MGEQDKKLSEIENKLRETVKDKDGLKTIIGKMGNDIERARETVENAKKELDAKGEKIK